MHHLNKICVAFALIGLPSFTTAETLLAADGRSPAAQEAIAEHLPGAEQAEALQRAETLIRKRQLDEATTVIDEVIRNFEALTKDAGTRYLCFSDDAEYRRYLDGAKSGANHDPRPVVRIHNAYATALSRKGWLLIERKDWDGAIGWFDRQILIEPFAVGAYTEKGYSLNRKGAPQEALAVYQQALDLAEATGQQRYSAIAMRGMGSTLIELERLDEAADMFDRSLILDPANRTALHELEYIGVQKLKAASLKGDVESSYRLGMLYLEDSEVVKVNYDEARRLFVSVAAKGYPGGDDGLGWMSLKGLGVRVNKVEGLRRIKQAAKQGFAPAEYHLGLMNQFGTGIPINPRQAVRWYRLSAGKGYVPAQKILAPICFQGVGMRPDRTEGLHWIVLAASNGDVEAQGKLGYLYFGNEGVTMDLDEAVKWTKSAAEQGDPIAQYMLATCYFKGTGLPSDAALGLAWLQKSCAGGNEAACKLLEELVGKNK
jgi:TPR repeat protein